MDGAPIERSKAQQPQKQRLEIPEHSLRFDLVVTTAPSTIMTHHHGSALNKHHARHARASCYNGTGHHQERLQVVRARKETPTPIHIDGSASTAWSELHSRPAGVILWNACWSCGERVPLIFRMLSLTELIILGHSTWKHSRVLKPIWGCRAGSPKVTVELNPNPNITIVAEIIRIGLLGPWHFNSNKEPPK